MFVMSVTQACAASASDRPSVFYVGDIVIGCCLPVPRTLSAVSGRRTWPRRLFVRRVAVSACSRRDPAAPFVLCLFLYLRSPFASRFGDATAMRWGVWFVSWLDDYGAFVPGGLVVLVVLGVASCRLLWCCSSCGLNCLSKVLLSAIGSSHVVSQLVTTHSVLFQVRGVLTRPFFLQMYCVVLFVKRGC